MRHTSFLADVTKETNIIFDSNKEIEDNNIKVNYTIGYDTDKFTHKVLFELVYSKDNDILCIIIELFEVSEETIRKIIKTGIDKKK